MADAKMTPGYRRRFGKTGQRDRLAEYRTGKLFEKRYFPEPEWEFQFKITMLFQQVLCVQLQYPNRFVGTAGIVKTRLTGTFRGRRSAMGGRYSRFGTTGKRLLWCCGATIGFAVR